MQMGIFVYFLIYLIDVSKPLKLRCDIFNLNKLILFLENLWEFTGTDESAFLEEIRITYLHELGHYFGFDEDDLQERNLN